VTPEALAANRDMVRDLNRLLEERLDGGDRRSSEFLASTVGSSPARRRWTTSSSSWRSGWPRCSRCWLVTADQRDELRSRMDALLRDDRLRWDLAQLAATMDELVPGGPGRPLPVPWRRAAVARGALDQIGRIERMDRSRNARGGQRRLRSVAGRPGRGPRPARRAVGAGAAGPPDLARILEEAGYVERDGDGSS
jgi:hypothetical protein